MLKGAPEASLRLLLITSVVPHLHPCLWRPTIIRLKALTRNRCWQAPADILQHFSEFFFFFFKSLSRGHVNVNEPQKKLKHTSRPSCHRRNQLMMVLLKVQTSPNQAGSDQVWLMFPRCHPFFLFPFTVRLSSAESQSKHVNGLRWTRWTTWTKWTRSTRRTRWPWWTSSSSEISDDSSDTTSSGKRLFGAD